MVYHICPYCYKFTTVRTQNGICAKYMQHIQHLLGSYFLCLVWDMCQIFSIWHISHIYCGCSNLFGKIFMCSPLGTHHTLINKYMGQDSKALIISHGLRFILARMLQTCQYYFLWHLSYSN